MAALLTAVALSACGGSGSSSSSSTSSSAGSESEATKGGGESEAGSGTSGLKMAYSAPFLTEAFQTTMMEESIQAAEEAGLETLQPANANQESGKQISDIQNLLTAGATGLVIQPVDPSALAPGFEAAAAAEVPVVAVGEAPSKGKTAMNVIADNSLMGNSACEEMGKLMHGEGKVLEMQGSLATTNGRERSTGFEECMAEQFPNIEVVTRPTKWVPEVATNEAQTALTTESDIGGIYLESGAVMLSGVTGDLKSDGRLAPVGSPDHVPLVTIDGTPEEMEAIRKGTLDASVSQPLNLFAKYGVEYLIQAYEGQTFKAGPTDHNSEIKMVAGNPTDFLEAPTVTKKNVEDPELWGNAAK